MKNFTPNSDSKGPTNLIAYNTSKTALNGLSAFFANENPKMRVVCVAPGKVSFVSNRSLSEVLFSLSSSTVLLSQVTALPI